MKPILTAVAALLIGASTPMMATAQEMSPEEIKKLALEAILENPEIVMQAVEILRTREAEEKEAKAKTALVDNADTIFSIANAEVLGNPDGDITIVEFADYNCGYCKRAMASVQQLLEADKGVRFIMREFPILSEGSVYAAKAALAAREQGKYEEFHFALMKLPRAEEKTVLKAAEALGLDIDQLKTDMESERIEEHIATSRSLAEALGITGTPSFVIGEELIPGFVPYEGLTEIIAEQRAKKG